MEQSYGNLGWHYFVFAAYAVAGITLGTTVLVAYYQDKKAREALKTEGETLDEKN